MILQQKKNKDIDYLKGIFGDDTVWKQCSFNTSKALININLGKPFRFNMPEIVYTYDSLRDGFIPPNHNDYILVEKKLQCGLQ